MSEKNADAEIQLDVDVMILDYLMYMATTALLEEANAQMWRSSHNNNDAKRHRIRFAVDQPNDEDFDDNNNSTGSDLTISMVDSFLRSFQLRHPSACVAKSLKLRLKLLRLTCLFTCRLSRCESTPSRDELEELRRANRKRAERFKSSSSGKVFGGERKRKRESNSITASTTAPILAQTFNPAFAQVLPISEEILQRNRELTLTTLLSSTNSPASAPAKSSLSPPSSSSHLSGANCLKPFYGSPDSVSLLDLLPFFVSTSAARANLGSEAEEFVVQPRWMELAAEWMLQAVLEQYRIYGAEGADVIEEAFAWGFSRAIYDGGRGGSGRKEVKGEEEESCEVDYEEEWMTSAIFARDVDGAKEEKMDGDRVSPTAEDKDDDGDGDGDGDGPSHGTKRVENDMWTRLKREYVQKVGTGKTRRTTLPWPLKLNTFLLTRKIYDFSMNGLERKKKKNPLSQF